MGSLFNVVMRIFSTLLGLLAFAMGGIWFMQGLNIQPAMFSRSFMVGDIQWTIYGTILALLGLGQVVWSNTRQRTR